MKKSAFFCLCLCLCVLLSALLSACATPELPEDSSVPAEESSEVLPVLEDENLLLARAYLDELLTAEKETGTVDWLTAERAEAIRTCVKQLQVPFLTEADVLRIAEQAVAVVSAEQEQSLLLPPCGVLAAMVWSPMASPGTCESFYTALVAYTLYLFTPPDYLFREEEVLDRVSLTSALWLYLPLAPLAGDYTSRLEALSLLREGKNGVELQLSGLVGEEHPLDCSLCGTPVLLRGSGEVLTLDLLELAQRENVTLPEDVFIARAEAYVQDWLYRFIFGTDTGLYGSYEFPNGNGLAVYQLLSAEDAQEIREQAELLPKPALTWELADLLLHSMLESTGMKRPLLLLPGVDGAEDVLLPPGVEGTESLDAIMDHNEVNIAAKAVLATAYLADLFTPSLYRDTDLFGIEGTYYALNGEESIYLLVTENNGLYLVEDEALNVEPLCLAPWVK